MGSEHFPLRPLAELINIFDNMRVPITKADRKPGPYPYYGASGIADYVDSYIFDGEYLLLAEDGDNLKTLNTPIAFLATGKFWVNNHAHILKGNKDNDTKFLCYALQVADVKSYLSGSTRPKLTQGDMKRIPVCAPTLSEQRLIAHILGSLDDKIELNRKMNETLETMAQALFKSWFVDFDPVIDNALAAGKPFPDELKARAELRKNLGRKRKPLPKEIQKLFPNEFVKTDEMGWVPKGWQWKAVNKIIEINPAVPLKKGTVARHVDMKALPTSGYSITEVVKKAYSGGAKFQKGDVLLARITPCLENGKTGIVDFLDGDEVGFGSTEFIVMRGKASICTPYIACLARTNEFREHCIQSMVGSSGRQRVQNACFSNFFLASPNSEEIHHKFNQLVQPSFEKMTKLSQESQTLTKLRDALLPKLLSGEIRINRIEKLLEKVV